MTSVPAIAARTRRPLRAPALAALVVALVVGILGMHALASHGTPTAPAAAMPAGATHEAHAHAVGADLPGQVATRAGADAGAPHQASMVMLCVVMLAAAALTLLVLLTGGLSRPLLPAAFRPAVVRAHARQWVRGTGPPHEWQFSVIRC